MKKIIPLLVLGFLLISCTHSSKVSIPHEKNTAPLIEKDILVRSTEQPLGEAIATEILKTNKRLEVSTEFETYANDIAKNVGLHSHRPSLTYQVLFVDSKEPITVGLPGGKILISRFFLNLIKSEAEFATLIGNQIAHIAKQHLIRNLMINFNYHQALLDGRITSRMVQQGMLELFNLGYEIDFINEADRLGSTYAMHVGYDIHAFENLLRGTFDTLSKKKMFTKTEFSYDMMNHRVSMNRVFIRELEKTDQTSFPKSEDRFATMMKKIKPVKQ